MKIYILIITGIAGVLFFQSCSRKQENHAHNHPSAQKYTCPMHPQIIQDSPGNCPICGMELVPVHGNQAGGELTLSNSQVLLANIKTMKAGDGEFNTTKILNAKLVTDPGRTEVVSSRFAGRIEQLFIRETGRRVSAGQPLFRIYSEQLQTLQQDYLLQEKQAEAFPSEKIYKELKQAAANKLRLFGLSASQIRELEQRKKVSPLITVYSPASGIVNELSVSEGEYVSEGSSVMKLESYNSLWVEADLYPSEAGEVKEGTPLKVVIDGLPGQNQEARVSFIAPQLNAGTRILTVRAQVKNPQNLLQPGMPAQVFLPSSKKEHAVKLPLDAVIREESGTHIWLAKGNNKFAIRGVQTGAEDDHAILITSGLSSGEEVVTSGAYLLYSEYVLKKGSEPSHQH